MFQRLKRAGASLLLVAVAAALALPLTPVRQAQAAPTGTLRVGWTSPTSLDPAKYNDAPDISIGVAIYDYLVTLDTKSQIHPSLAKEWKVSDDKKTYTLTLQSGVKFHDGSDFSSKDVKFTFERLQKKESSNVADLFGSIASIEAKDPTTVVFTLKDANPSFLNSLTDYHTAILKDGTADPAKEMNGTGPFKKVSVSTAAGERAVFEANPNYWQAGLPKVARLEMVFASNTEDLVPALRGGQIDWLARLGASQLAELKDDPNITVGRVEINQFSNVRLRSDRKPGSDPKVRMAFKLATDRADLNQKVFDGLATPANDTPIGPNYGPLFDKSITAPKPDPDAAKKLLADAGYPDGLTMDFYVPNNEFSGVELATVLQQQWKKAGINVNLKTIPPSTYYTDNVANNWLDADLAVTFWASRPDPQPYLDQLYKTGAAYNEAHFSDAELDKLIDQARSESDMTKRAGIMSQISKILSERGPSIIPYYTPALFASRKGVAGIEVSPDPGLTSFANATVGGS